MEQIYQPLALLAVIFGLNVVVLPSEVLVSVEFVFSSLGS